MCIYGSKIASILISGFSAITLPVLFFFLIFSVIDAFYICNYIFCFVHFLIRCIHGYHISINISSQPLEITIWINCYSFIAHGREFQKVPHASQWSGRVSYFNSPVTEQPISSNKGNENLYHFTGDPVSKNSLLSIHATSKKGKILLNHFGVVFRNALVFAICTDRSTSFRSTTLLRLCMQSQSRLSLSTCSYCKTLSGTTRNDLHRAKQVLNKCFAMCTHCSFLSRSATTGFHCIQKQQ